SQVGPIRGGLNATAIDRGNTAAGVGDTRLLQQPLNGSLGSLVLALPKLMVTNSATRIEKVQCRPILVAERTPDRIIVVDHHRIVDPHLLNGAANVGDVVFEREFGRVHAD